MLAPLKPRVCACGCGKVFTPHRNDTKYATETCRTRAYRQRKKPTWFDRLNSAEQDAWTYLRLNEHQGAVRAALLVELEGRANGPKAARRALAQIMWVFGTDERAWTPEALREFFPADLVTEVAGGMALPGAVFDQLS